MKNISGLKREECCGCKACMQVCPKACITFDADAEGFAVPQVDETACINCTLCVKSCPQLNDLSHSAEQTVYAAYSKNDAVLEKSTSGGLFYELAARVLSRGGAVFGCAYDQTLTAKHVCIEDRSQLYRLQGSKYVQSDTNDTYTQVKPLLETGRTVLYSGTPCQIAGLRTFLKKEYENLITIDLVCHGVPSPALFHNYLCYMGEKMHGEITAFHFRDKKSSEWGQSCRASTAGKEKITDGALDPYYRRFLHGETYREVCYSCKYSNKDRVSDLTLADYWGIKEQHPEFYNKNGVSLVLVNSQKGMALFEEIADKITFIESTIEKASKENHNLTAPSYRRRSRDTVYLNLEHGVKMPFFKMSMKEKIKGRAAVLLPEAVKKKLQK